MSRIERSARTPAPAQRRGAAANPPPASTRPEWAMRPGLLVGGANRQWRALRGAAWLGLALLGDAPAAPAAEMRWEGTLGFDFPALPPLLLTGTGVASLDRSGSSHLGTLHLAGGLEATATAPVTDPEVTTVDGIVALRASASLGRGSLAPFGPGPLTRSALPVRGVIAVCLFDPACLPGGFAALPLSASSGAVGVGVGGTLFAPGVSVLAAPWTVGTALVELTSNGGGPIQLPTTGWVHGALSFTSSTALAGGALSLVTPIQVDSANGRPLAGFGRLTLRFVPEPDRALILAAGAACLVALGRLRRCA
jgi:hypothetical protein